jgi:hypothetical protein
MTEGIHANIEGRITRFVVARSKYGKSTSEISTSEIYFQVWQYIDEQHLLPNISLNKQYNLLDCWVHMEQE